MVRAVLLFSDLHAILEQHTDTISPYAKLEIKHGLRQIQSYSRYVTKCA